MKRAKVLNKTISLIYIKVYKKLALASMLAMLLVLPVASMAIIFPVQPTQAAIVIPTFINTVVTVVWWVFIAITIIFFMIIGILFLTNLGNPEKISEARRALIWAGAGIVVAVFAFGIIRLVMNAFGI